MAESELGVGSAVQTDVGSTFGRWVTEQLGRTWPRDDPPSVTDPQGMLEALLAPALEPRHRTFVRPIERAAEVPVSMVAAVAMRDVLAAWRAAERELATIDQDSPAWPHANARVIGLRVAYRRLFDEAIVATTR